MFGFSNGLQHAQKFGKMARELEAAIVQNEAEVAKHQEAISQRQTANDRARRIVDRVKEFIA